MLPQNVLSACLLVEVCRILRDDEFCKVALSQEIIKHIYLLEEKLF